MSFTLAYWRGSFRQTEVFDSRNDAIARAQIALQEKGCSGFQIDHNGVVVMSESEILARRQDSEKR